MGGPVLQAWPTRRRGLSGSHLLSMRHTHKSFIINEGGPEAHPTGSPPGFPLAHSDSCGVVRRNPQLDGEWLLLEFVREEGPRRSVAMGVLRWLVPGVGGERGGEPHSYRCGLGSEG